MVESLPELSANIFFSKKSFISHPAIKHMICRGVIWVIQKTHKTIGHSLSYHLLRRSKYTYSSPKTLKFKSVLLFELKREVFLQHDTEKTCYNHRKIKKEVIGRGDIILMCAFFVQF